MFLFFRALTVATYSFECRTDCTPPEDFNQCFDNLDYCESSSRESYVPVVYTAPTPKLADANLSGAVALLVTSITDEGKVLKSRLYQLFHEIENCLDEDVKCCKEEIKEVTEDTVNKTCVNETESAKLLFDKLVSDINDVLSSCTDDVEAEVTAAFLALNAKITAEITRVAGLKNKELMDYVRNLSSGLLPTLLSFTNVTKNTVETSIRATEEACKEEALRLLTQFYPRLETIVRQACSQLSTEMNKTTESKMGSLKINCFYIDEIKSKFNNYIKNHQSNLTRAIQEWGALYLNNLCKKPYATKSKYVPQNYNNYMRRAVCS